MKTLAFEAEPRAMVVGVGVAEIDEASTQRQMHNPKSQSSPRENPCLNEQQLPLLHVIADPPRQ